MTTDRGLSSQLALELPHRVARGRSDFFVADSNREAVRWIDAWPTWDSGGLVIYGPPSSGKTHLLHVWLDRTGGRLVNAESLDAQSTAQFVAFPQNLAIDDLEALQAEETLFHIVNTLKQAQKSVVFASRLSPMSWSFRLQDLASRIRSFPAIQVGLPDDALLRAVLEKLFQDRQVLVRLAVIDYLIQRMPRDFSAAKELVADIDRRSLSGGRMITVPLARESLSALVKQRSHSVST